MSKENPVAVYALLKQTSSIECISGARLLSYPSPKDLNRSLFVALSLLFQRFLPIPGVV